MLAFDTLTAARELQAAGFEQAQAEAVAKMFRYGHRDLATKDDIGWVKWALGILVAINLAILAITFNVLRVLSMSPGGVGPA